MDISRTNEGYTSCGPVVEMSWHRAGVLLLGAQSCLPVPEVPAVGLTSAQVARRRHAGPTGQRHGEDGLPWTGTTRVIHRRSTGPTARIALGPIGRTAAAAAPGLGSASKPIGRPGASGGGACASRRRRRHPAAEATRKRRQRTAATTQSDGERGWRRRTGKRGRRGEEMPHRGWPARRKTMANGDGRPREATATGGRASACPKEGEERD
uniref:Uncharacterized protein n=1 Tax=Oryza sativa subsp. japonica TaxID=39947 RepID=Q8H844_ORYSJ|nr:hypothetical protein [Oryza sativa Japonica Group]